MLGVGEFGLRHQDFASDRPHRSHGAIAGLDRIGAEMEQGNLAMLLLHFDRILYFVDADDSTLEVPEFTPKLLHILT